uniref:Uncharacterized protein n=1 Tax=Spongospora subterranea TaxID=70186 RepID=A0A0H5R1A9_9EUKA|eukprot:CRZ07970.1 hypothetical protein [Spongospora subterranea]
MLEDMAFLSLFLEWTIGHLHLIQLTWESSSYAMPLGSLYFVFAWNIFKTVYSHSPLSFVFGAIWTCCDLVIIYLTIRNLRRPDNPDFLTSPSFKQHLIPILAMIFLFWVTSILIAISQFGEVSLYWAGVFLSFFMSVSFILMGLSRRSSRQQHEHIILSKVAVSALLVWYSAMRFDNLYMALNIFYLSIPLDVVYLVVLEWFKEPRFKEVLSAPASPVETKEQASSA